MPMPKEWTEEEDSRLRFLWAGELTGTKIGEAMGKTKNAIIGRANRLGLPPRKKGTILQRIEKINENRDLIRGVGDPNKRGDFSYCQYLDGNTFCHHPIDNRQQFAFCDTHMKVAFVAGSARRKKSTPINHRYAR